MPVYPGAFGPTPFPLFHPQRLTSESKFEVKYVGTIDRTHPIAYRQSIDYFLNMCHVISVLSLIYKLN